MPFDFKSASTLTDEAPPTIKGRGQPHVWDEFDDAVKVMIDTGKTHKVKLPKMGDAELDKLVSSLTNKMQNAVKRAGKGLSVRRDATHLWFILKERRPFAPRAPRSTNGANPA